MRTLILAQHDNKTLHPATLGTITAAQKLGKSETELLISGYKCNNVAKLAQKLSGITKIIKADAPVFEHFLPEEITPLILSLIKDREYTHILAPTSDFGINILPRIAALLDVPQISNVCDIINKETFAHPVYAGNAIATIRSDDPLKILSIRGSSFEQANTLATNKDPVSLTKIPPTRSVNLGRFVKSETIQTERPNLANAKIVVAGGHALGSKENFKLIEKLADKLGAAVGATRLATDAGYIHNDAQIGQSGKNIAPSLYIAIGISGAPQHTSGIKDAKVIVAINKDEKAPICEMADYTLNADIFETLPELIEKL